MEQVLCDEILERLNQIQIDISFIKERLPEDCDFEGKLSDWAKESLAEARKEDVSKMITLDELRKEIENGVCD